VARIDVEAIAREALETFPPWDNGDDWAARNHAGRLFFKAVGDLRTSGAGPSEDEIQALQEALDGALQRTAARFKPKRRTFESVRSGKVSKADSPPPPSLDHLATLVGDAFSAPTDGSEERARVLAERARGTVRAAIERPGVGWLTRRRLWWQVERMIRAHMSEVTVEQR